jgi:TonB family protein
MREHSIAISASLMFHIIIIVIFLRVPFDQYVKPKLMVLDFSLEKGQLGDDTQIANRKSQIVGPETQVVNHKSQIVSRTAENEGTITNREQNVQRSFTAEALLAKQNNGNPIASDPAGQVALQGDIGHAGTQGESVRESGLFSGKGSQNTAASSGKGKILNFESNGVDERDFAFIRDTILKRIKDKYPDRARRMGWEGKVVLSFDLFENGSIRNVKIISSSGFHILDNSAKEVIEKTTFTRKIPYSRLVQLPVEYRLQ